MGIDYRRQLGGSDARRDREPERGYAPPDRGADVELGAQPVAGLDAEHERARQEQARIEDGQWLGLGSIPAREEIERAERCRLVRARQRDIRLLALSQHAAEGRPEIARYRVALGGPDAC